MRFMFASLIAACSLAFAAPAVAQTTPPCVVFDRAGNAIACTPTMAVDASGVYAGSTATNGGTAPTSSSLVAGKTAAGTIVPLTVSVNGVFAAPVAGTANRVVTKTSVSANTSTTICPTATTPTTTEIQVSAGPVGLGLNGQTLTGVAYGTTTSDPDIRLPTADTLYTLPVAATNAITDYSASAHVALCIQTIRP